MIEFVNTLDIVGFPAERIASDQKAAFDGVWGADRVTVRQNDFKLESRFDCQGRKRFET